MTTAPATLTAAEVYGPAWQGEGPSAGRRCSFIRLMGCNLTCSWCDEAHTWDASRFDLHAQGKRLAADDIADAALACDPGLVVITGGEPMLHQRQPGWGQLMRRLEHRRVEIETNGTVMPETGSWPHAHIWYNVSPKLANSGVDAAKRRHPGVIGALLATGRASFKFVCTSPGDVAEVQAVTTMWGIPPGLVWIMPEGVQPGLLLDHARALAPAVHQAGFNFTLRQHVLIYGTEREPR